MADLSTVARPYAEALFAAVRQDASLMGACGVQVQQLAEIAALEDVRIAMADPRLEDAQRTEIFLSLVKPVPSDLIRNFVSVLMENDRISLLSHISELFDALCDEANGIAQANITSAFPMTEQQVSDLIKLLEPKFGHKLKPHVNIDTSLIGGVRVQVGDHVLDTSVQAQLVRMRDTMAV